MKNDSEVNEKMNIKILYFLSYNMSLFSPKSLTTNKLIVDAVFKFIDTVVTLKELNKILNYVLSFKKIHIYFFKLLFEIIIKF